MKCMMIFFLALILAQISSTTKQDAPNQITKENALEVMKDLFIPQGHELDCYKRCKICINQNSFLNALVKYQALYKTKDFTFEIPKLKDLIMKEAIELKKAYRETEKSAVLIDEEMKTKENELNSEIDQAVKTIVETEGIKDEIEVKKTAVRIRNRMLEKYRKEAQLKLNEIEAPQRVNQPKVQTATTTTATAEATTTVTKTATTTAATITTTINADPMSSVVKLISPTLLDIVTTDLYKVYFKICIVDSNIFYSTPESDFP